MTSGKPCRGFAFLRTAVALTVRQVETFPGTGADGPAKAVTGGGTAELRAKDWTTGGGGRIGAGIVGGISLRNWRISMYAEKIDKISPGGRIVNRPRTTTNAQ